MADAFALFDKFEGKLSDCNGNLVRAAVEFAKEWRRDRVLQKLEALLIMTDGDHLFTFVLPNEGTSLRDATIQRILLLENLLSTLY